MAESDRSSLRAEVVMLDGRRCEGQLSFPIDQLGDYRVYQKGGVDPALSLTLKNGQNIWTFMSCITEYQGGFEESEQEKEEKEVEKFYLPTPNQHTKLIYIFVDAEGNVAPEFSPWKALRRVAKLVRKQEQLKQITHQSGTEETGVEDEAQMPGEQEISRTDSMHKSQNLTFIDEAQDFIYDQPTPMDPTRSLQDMSDVELNNFFSRPILIDRYTWTNTARLGEIINPWQLYLRNKRVCNRIANFNLFRATMKIKFVLNGNAFLYGMLLASYEPYRIYNTWASNRFLGGGFDNADAVHESQCPHVWLNPTTSSGGIITIPYFFHQNHCNLTLQDAETMGNLIIRQMTALQQTNGSTASVNISIFAWLEDVHLTGLTSRNYYQMTSQSGLEYQSGAEKDEADAKRIISRPASTVAKYASYLKGMPVIGKFAMATELGANAVANVARLFGYCKPPITTDPLRVVQCAQSSLAVCTVPEYVNKLTVDDKQELTIDPSIAGLANPDSLDIRNIAMRESYITEFDWLYSNVGDDLLWNCRVSPVIWRESFGVGVDTQYHFPACAVAALPFRYWTGSMKYRFQIVATPFHRGRLKIVYDPNYVNFEGTTASPAEYNVNYVHIIDIAEQPDFTIEIGNSQPFTLLNHHYPAADAYTEVYSTSRYVGNASGNGVLAIYVLNELTEPGTVGSTTGVNILVSVSAGDDFETFVPDDWWMQFNPYGDSVIPTKEEPLEQQSGYELNDSAAIAGFNTEQMGAPQQSKVIRLGIGKTNTTPDINKIYTGESVTNFRTLLKRYQTYRAIVSSISSTDATYELSWRVRLPWFPVPRGYWTDGLDTTSANRTYTYVNTTLLNWLGYCFSGMRGSVRYKLMTQQDKEEPLSYSVSRVPEEDFARSNEFRTDYSRAAATNFGSQGEDIRARSGVFSRDTNYGQSFRNLNAMYCGGNYWNGILNPHGEFEIPFYSRNRFCPGKRNSAIDRIGECFDLTGFAEISYYDRYFLMVAAGEDFQYYFWTGMVPMYYEQAPPAA